MLGGGSLISAALFIVGFSFALWAGYNFYRERDFFAATLILASWALLFLS